MRQSAESLTLAHGSNRMILISLPLLLRSNVWHEPLSSLSRSLSSKCICFCLFLFNRSAALLACDPTARFLLTIFDNASVIWPSTGKSGFRYVSSPVSFDTSLDRHFPDPYLSNTNIISSYTLRIRGCERSKRSTPPISQRVQRVTVASPAGRDPDTIRLPIFLE